MPVTGIYSSVEHLSSANCTGCIKVLITLVCNVKVVHVYTKLWK